MTILNEYANNKVMMFLMFQQQQQKEKKLPKISNSFPATSFTDFIFVKLEKCARLLETIYTVDIFY